MHGLHNTQVDLSALRIVVASRFRTSVPVMNLADFLRTRAAELTLVRHPFPFNKDIGSTVMRWVGGVEKETCTRSYCPTMGNVWFHIVSFFLTIWWLLGRPRSDMFIGLGALEACAGVLLRMIGKTRTVVFYSIDFVPKRFDNRVVNVFFNWIERFVVSHVDAVWNLSSVMVELRERYRGVHAKHRTKQIEVPIGTDEHAQQVPFESVHRNEICYVGHIREGQGVGMLLDAFKDVRVRISDARLLLMGGGELLGAMKERANTLGIAGAVEFTGFMADQKEMESRLAHAAVAIAPYDDAPDNFTRFTDPGKIKTYLAAGVPVVMTNIVPIAEEIDLRRAGVAVPYKKEAFVDALTQLLQNETRLRECRENARKLSTEYRWDTLFTHALQVVLHQ